MAARSASKLSRDAESATQPWARRFVSLFSKNTGLSTVTEDAEEEKDESKERSGGVIRKLRPDMIRRMDDAPKLVDPSGWISEGQSVPMNRAPTMQSTRQLVFADDVSTGLPSRTHLDSVLESSKTEGHQNISLPVNPRL